MLAVDLLQGNILAHMGGAAEHNTHGFQGGNELLDNILGQTIRRNGVGKAAAGLLLPLIE